MWLVFKCIETLLNFLFSFDSVTSLNLFPGLQKASDGGFQNSSPRDNTCKQTNLKKCTPGSVSLQPVDQDARS